MSACSVTGPLCTATVSGPPEALPSAIVASAEARTSTARRKTQGFVIWTSELLLAQSGCLCLVPDATTPHESGSIYQRVCSGRFTAKPLAHNLDLRLPHSHFTMT